MAHKKTSQINPRAEKSQHTNTLKTGNCFFFSYNKKKLQTRSSQHTPKHHATTTTIIAESGALIFRV